MLVCLFTSQWQIKLCWPFFYVDGLWWLFVVFLIINYCSQTSPNKKSPFQNRCACTDKTPRRKTAVPLDLSTFPPVFKLNDHRLTCLFRAMFYVLAFVDCGLKLIKLTTKMQHKLY